MSRGIHTVQSRSDGQGYTTEIERHQCVSVHPSTAFLKGQSRRTFQSAGLHSDVDLLRWLSRLRRASSRRCGPSLSGELIVPQASSALIIVEAL